MPASPASARSAPRSRWPTSPTCRRAACRSPTPTSPTRTRRSPARPLHQQRPAQGPGDPATSRRPRPTTRRSPRSSSAWPTTASTAQHPVRLLRRRGRPLRRRQRRPRGHARPAPARPNDRLHGAAIPRPDRSASRQVDDPRAPAHQLGDTTPFYNEPQGNAMYITGNPGPTAPTTRNSSVTSPRDRERPLRRHAPRTSRSTRPTRPSSSCCTSSTPIRTARRRSRCSRSPTSSSRRARATDCDRAADGGIDRGQRGCELLVVNDGFAWNHGYYAPEIDNTWLGLVGPGVAHKGVDGFTPRRARARPDGANSHPQLVTVGRRTRDVGRPHRHPADADVPHRTEGRLHRRRARPHRGPDCHARARPASRTSCRSPAATSSSTRASGSSAPTCSSPTPAALKTGRAATTRPTRRSSRRSSILGAARDALATQIKNDLFNAEFNNHPIPGANDLKQCQNILAQAASLNR